MKIIKIDWCKILGHSYEPIFIKGAYADKEVKFIGCKCRRCDFGEDELLDANKKMDRSDFCTYSEKYWHEHK